MFSNELVGLEYVIGVNEKDVDTSNHEKYSPDFYGVPLEKDSSLLGCFAMGEGG